MSKGPHFDDESRFKSFCESPKTFSFHNLQSAHRILSKTLSEKKSSVTKNILIDILMNFVPNEIKSYHFKRMNRSILVELALCIVQDILQNGEGRAEFLVLELVKTSSGGSKVVIADPFVAEDDNYDDDFLKEIDAIDAAEFNLCDKSGNTPDKKIASGEGFAPPFLPPDAEGGFATPRKNTTKLPTAVMPEVGPSN